MSMKYSKAENPMISLPNLQVFVLQDGWGGISVPKIAIISWRQCCAIDSF